jgi:fatty acid desaturase
MLVAGAISSYLALSDALQPIMVWALIMSGYGFIFALVLGAATGLRALIPKPIGFNTLLFVGHLVGAVGAILGVGVLLYGLM